MSMKLNEIVRDFFLRLNCTVDGEDVITINNVPKDFELLYGKSAPYKFSFVKESSDENTEYIIHSSHLISSISEYLKNKANTTILALDLAIDIKEVISSLLQVNGYFITRIDKKSIYDYIFKLSFETSLQYLNENEKIITTLYIHENQVIENFNLENYNTTPGDKKEVIIKEINKEITTAKEFVRESLKKKIILITEKLKRSLDKEIERVNIHYETLLKETNSEVTAQMMRLEELKKNTMDDKELVKAKMNRIQETIEKLNEKISPQDLVREKQFQIQEEKRKHSLNISSAFLNKTIIYYPVHQLGVYLSNGKKVRKISFQFNPLTKNIKELRCEHCTNEMKGIRICVANHCVCDHCVSVCSSCHASICYKCKKIPCSFCKKSLCQECNTLCGKCKKPLCKIHQHQDFMTKGNLCLDCSAICSFCKKATEKKYFKKVGNKLICPKCIGGKVEVFKNS